MTPGTRIAPETVHRIAQEIRTRRSELTVEESWWQRQPKSESRTEGFRRIVFWRRVLDDAERRLVTDATD